MINHYVIIWRRGNNQDKLYHNTVDVKVDPKDTAKERYGRIMNKFHDSIEVPRQEVVVTNVCMI